MTMTNIRPVGFWTTQPYVNKPSTDSPIDNGHDRVIGDSVQFSDVGMALSRLAAQNETRGARIARIRSEVRSGNYDAARNLDSTIDAVVRSLISEG